MTRSISRPIGKLSAMVCAAGLLAASGSPAQAAPSGKDAQECGEVAGVLLEVDYESGTLDSGIPGMDSTHATADDASYIVDDGSNGSDYAVAHKVTLGDPGYYSEGAYRSESSTAYLEEGQIHPGDEHRYEFSIKLPEDWESWESDESANGEIIFQGKHAGGNAPSWYMMTKRNQIAFRSPTLDLQQAAVPDYRPHIGEWMHFRVDVRWTEDQTGYYRVWTKLAGETDYTLAVDLQNVQTWHPVNPAEHGYLKWGLYRAATSLEDGDVPTRIIYHDDIRISELPDQ